MRFRRRLRSRIILSFLLLGTLLSGLLAISVLTLQSYLEDQLIGATLEQELDDYVAQLRADPSVVEPFYTRIQGYVTRPGDPNRSVAAQVRSLDTGVHDVTIGGVAFKAAVRKDDDLWAFLTYDVSDNSRLTTRLIWALLGVVLLFSLLSLAIGLWSSSRVMKPVTELAGRLEHLEEHAPDQRLAERFADDEVGQLAAALDSYAERMVHLVERDREFNADVSHELRTPLAVISGATELLLAQEDLPSRTRHRLLRIARAARQSTDITTALLHLVRSERGTHEDSRSYDVARVAEDVMQMHRPLLESRPLELRLLEQAKLSVIAPESVLAVTIGNLISNAVRYTAEGEVVVTVSDGQLTVEDTGPGIPEEELARVMDRHFRGARAEGKGSGLGLAIVKRLCRLYGWQIHFANREEGGLRATLNFFGKAAG
ncbi:MAG: HAMP domain-containing histidine kinase [Xanthomonadales bacterium]|nr:HAMP domain-containing histidine kinase [Xanthomonadales bacterium]